MSDGSRLHVVNEQGEVLRDELRETIHRTGLLHREVHVYFITPEGLIVFQHRAPDKDTYPDLLDVAVGGHIEIGDDSIATAVKEVKEETGLDVTANELVFLGKARSSATDARTGMINNVIDTRYGYLYTGDVRDLEPEPEKIIGFESWSLTQLKQLSEVEKQRFVPLLLTEEYLNLMSALADKVAPD